VQANQITDTGARTAERCKVRAERRVVQIEPEAMPKPTGILTGDPVQQSARPTLEQHRDDAMHESHTLARVRLPHVVEQRGSKNIRIVAPGSQERIVDRQVMTAIKRRQTGQQSPQLVVANEGAQPGINGRIRLIAQRTNALSQPMNDRSRSLSQFVGHCGNRETHNGSDPTMAVRNRSYTGAYMALMTSAPARPPMITTANRTINP